MFAHGTGHNEHPAVRRALARPMRKAREVRNAKAEGTFATARCLSASLGYSSIRPMQLPEHIAVLLWLPQSTSSLPSELFPALHHALMSTKSSEESASELSAVFIVDCTPLVPPGGNAREIMDKEVCTLLSGPAGSTPDVACAPGPAGVRSWS